MNKLPKGWVETKLGVIATLRGEKVSPASLPDAPFIGLEDIEPNTSRILRVRKGSDVKSSVAKFGIGDLLYSRLRPYLNKVTLAEFDGLASAEILVLQLTDATEGEFIRRRIMTPEFLDFAAMLDKGDRPRVNYSEIAQFRIALPPLPEQKRIVAKVDGLTARTARASIDLARIPTLIARYKQRLLTQAFSGELTMGWRASTGETEDRGADTLGIIANQREQIRRERSLRSSGRNRSLSVQSPDLPDLPASWAWSTFNDCAWDLTVGHVGPMKDRYKAEGVPFLRSLNIRENFVDLQKVVYIDEGFHGELRKSEIRAGELVVVRTGAPGTAAVVPETLGRANCSDLVIARLVPALNPHYAAYYMNSEFAKSAVREMQVGVAQQHFNVGAMSEMPVPIAPEREQTEIVRRIESAFNWLDRMAADHAAASKLLPKLDATILAKAFRGELVLQDPNDEPASILLDRIRTEREAAPKLHRGRTARSKALNETLVVSIPTRDTERKTHGASDMTKSRQDDDVMGQPYLAGLIKKGSAGTTQDLFRASDLPVADFYKQLAWEIEHKHIRDDDEKLEAF